MEFTPHTPQDELDMLAAVGMREVADLFAAIPRELLLEKALDIPPALSEPELMAELTTLADRCRTGRDMICFAGGGAYDHHVPAAVQAIAGRAELATSYTPYQPELSQGVLQALFEFQTLVCEIYGMEVANASLYDGAAAVAEAVTLAVRVTRRERIVVAGTIHPHHLQVLKTYSSGLGLDIVVAPLGTNGTVEWTRVDAAGAAAVVVASPSYLGLVEDIAAAAGAAHAAGALCIAIADPVALGILEPPGALGADIAVGEGQALGNPMSYGGPALGLFATRTDFVRQVPGRIAGETLDADGRRAYVLTLQAREQHIRRARATSNVCTNQTLLAIAAGVHLSWLGPEGLRKLGEVCARRTAFAAARLDELPGCRVRFGAPRFKELVLETPLEGPKLVRALAGRGFLVGPSLGRDFPELGSSVLVAVTELRTEDEITSLATAIEKVLAG